MNPLTPERFMIDDTLIEKDYDYMHRLIPDTVRSIFEHVEDEVRADKARRTRHKDGFLIQINVWCQHTPTYSSSTLL